MTIAAAPDRDAYLDEHAAALAAQLSPFTDEEAGAVARILAAIDQHQTAVPDELTVRAA
jgi:hypothetical protein